jgi:hypothetical protein
MASGLRSRHLVAAAVTAVAIFLAVLVLLALRMASGDDPSLGAGTPQPASTSVTQAQGPAIEEQSYEAYGDDAYESGAPEGQSEDATVEPQTGQAPLQSGTS